MVLPLAKSDCGAGTPKGKLVARFRFFLIGTSQAPIVDVPQSNLSELGDTMGCRRFLEGKVAGIDGNDVECGVLIPINRIQMISEVES